MKKEIIDEFLTNIVIEYLTSNGWTIPSLENSDDIDIIDIKNKLYEFLIEWHNYKEEEIFIGDDIIERAVNAISNDFK